jgi:hypothetical protein
MKKSKKLQIYELLVKSAYAAYIATLIGNAPPATHKQYKFFSNPSIGDLVLEVTTIGHKNRDITQNMGHLIRIEKAKNGNIFEDKWVIKTLYHNKEFAWSNANFIRVLDIEDSFYKISHVE